MLLWIPLSSPDFSPTGLSPCLACFPKTVRLNHSILYCGPNPSKLGLLVWALSLSLAATQKIDFSFSSFRYLDVSVPWVPSVKLCIHFTVTRLCLARFPHSDISGSMAICASPKLFAAYHVLHRLLVPRHPPYALISLTFCFFFHSWELKYIVYFSSWFLLGLSFLSYSYLLFIVRFSLK